MLLLDVSMRLSVWSNDSGISINPKILCPEDMYHRPTTSYNTCRRPFSSSFGPKERKHYCAATSCRPFCSIREKNLRYYGAKTPSKCRSLCKAASCVCPPQRTTENVPLMLDKITRFLDQTAMGFCTLHRRVQIHHGERFRTSADLEGTTYQIPSIQHS
ncbi:hypothetical protein AVEN_200080-1 [Araneus ventricosus]|uniref:Uncharacterized protein n=1 Tax=Araneus ventricosus TaxID=182803 RepID=A0A4Y2TB51_ARAVE|nr:hypothetical protein AVEN_200080-1 [Araneus ventricosus]